MLQAGRRQFEMKRWVQVIPTVSKVTPGWKGTMRVEPCKRAAQRLACWVTASHIVSYTLGHTQTTSHCPSYMEGLDRA